MPPKYEKLQQLQLLKEHYMAIGEAYAALRDSAKTTEQIRRLHMEVKSQEEKIKELLVIVRAHELNSGDTMQICPNCHGAGALLIGEGETDECLLCDGVGARIKNKEV